MRWIGGDGNRSFLVCCSCTPTLLPTRLLTSHVPSNLTLPVNQHTDRGTTPSHVTRHHTRTWDHNNMRPQQYKTWDHRKKQHGTTTTHNMGSPQTKFFTESVCLVTIFTNFNWLFQTGILSVTHNECCGVGVNTNSEGYSNYVGHRRTKRGIRSSRLSMRTIFSVPSTFLFSIKMQIEYDNWKIKT